MLCDLILYGLEIPETVLMLKKKKKSMQKEKRKKVRQSEAVNSIFLQNKLFGWGAASMKKFN